MKRLRITVGALVAVIILAAAGTVGFFVLRSEQLNSVTDFSKELRRGLVRGCKKSGNPLRTAVRELLHDEIQQSENVKLISKFFPQIPLPELQQILEVQNVHRKEIIQKLKPLDCDTIYPKAPSGGKN